MTTGYCDSVKRGKEKVCYAVIGGMVLVADSELYVEDAVKQLNDKDEGKKDETPRYKNVNRLFLGRGGIECIFELVSVL